MTLYLWQEGDELTAFTGGKFDNEAQLEALLAGNPRLLADCVQMEDATPWLHVATSAGIARRAGEANSLEADVLFIAGDGMPTIVEVKQSSDTRIRREVLGQMIDYAANGSQHWPQGWWKEKFEETHGDQAPAQLREHAGAIDPAVYWQGIDESLSKGNIRVVLVADAIPFETRNLLNFHNHDSRSLEVLGIEIRPIEIQTSAGSIRVLSPALVAGQVIDAPRRQASSGRRRTWTEEDFVHQVPPGEAREAARLIIAALKQRSSARLWYGSGAINASCTPRPAVGNQGALTMMPSGGGTIRIKLNWRPRDSITDTIERNNLVDELAACFEPGALDGIRDRIWEPGHDKSNIPLAALDGPQGAQRLASWVHAVHSRVAELDVKGQQ